MKKNRLIQKLNLENLLIISSALKKEKNFIFYGTLLGIVREKNILNSARSKWILNDIDTNFIVPVIGQISGVFGTERFYNNKKGNYHNGVDFAAKTGTNIIAPSSGTVLLTGDFFYNGKFVLTLMLQHFYLEKLELKNTRSFKKILPSILKEYKQGKK